MPDKPAALLRQAAEKLRQAAADAGQPSPSPWHLDQSTYGPGIIYAADNATIVVDRSMDDSDEDHRDMPYIALVHPGVGAALADWLEHVADFLAGVHETHGRVTDLAVHNSRHALAVARQVLGVAE